MPSPNPIAAQWTVGSYDRSGINPSSTAEVVSESHGSSQLSLEGRRIGDGDTITVMFDTAGTAHLLSDTISQGDPVMRYYEAEPDEPVQPAAFEDEEPW